MDKLSELKPGDKIRKRVLTSKVLNNLSGEGLWEIAQEVAQLEAALKEIRNVANEVHEENINSLNPPSEDTRIVPLWVIDKCSKALNDERDWLEALKAGGE